MITLLPSVDLNGVAIGTIKSVDWSRIGRQPTPSELIEGKQAKVLIYNESGCGLNIHLNVGGQRFFCPAGGWQEIRDLALNETGLTATVIYVIPNAPVTQLIVVYVDQDSSSIATILGNSPMSVSGSVNTAATSVVQDSQPNAQAIMEATPTGQPQNILVTTDGAAKFGGFATSAAGKIIDVAGVGTVGNLGVPLLVALAEGVQISDNNLDVIFTYTVPVDTEVMLMTYVETASNSATANATNTVNWTSRYNGINFNNASTIPNVAANSFLTSHQFLAVRGGTNLQVLYQKAVAGIVNDRVTAALYRVN